MKYVYPAKIFAEQNGYTICFPDVEGAIAQGDNLFDALANAEDALCEILIAYENFKAGKAEKMTNTISMPNEMVKFPADSTLIKADTDVYRKNPSAVIELWYNPNTKKYFTALSDDDAEVKLTAEKLLKKFAGIE